MLSELRNMRDVVSLLRTLRATALGELATLNELLDEVVHHSGHLVDTAVAFDAEFAALFERVHPDALEAVTALRARSAALSLVANQLLGTLLALRSHVARWHVGREPPRASNSN